MQNINNLVVPNPKLKKEQSVTSVTYYIKQVRVLPNLLIYEQRRTPHLIFLMDRNDECLQSAPTKELHSNAILIRLLIHNRNDTQKTILVGRVRPNIEQKPSDIYLHKHHVRYQ